MKKPGECRVQGEHGELENRKIMEKVKKQGECRVQGEHGEPENREIVGKVKKQGECRVQGEHGEPENREIVGKVKKQGEGRVQGEHGELENRKNTEKVNSHGFRILDVFHHLRGTMSLYLCMVHGILLEVTLYVLLRDYGWEEQSEYCMSGYVISFTSNCCRLGTPVTDAAQQGLDDPQ